MDPSECKWILFEMIIAVKTQTTYLKTIDANDSFFNKDEFEGRAFAYYKVMDEILETAKRFNLKLDEFGLEDYDPLEILDYKPLNYKE